MERCLHTSQQLKEISEFRVTGRITTAGDCHPFEVSINKLEVAQNSVCNLAQ